MTKAVFVVRSGALMSAEPEADAELAKIADGTLVVVEITKPRGQRGLYQLRVWWKMMSIVATNMPVFGADPRAVSDMVLIACGHCYWRIDPISLGQTPVPKSLALESMTEDAFNRLWERAKFYIHESWLPIGTDKLQAEIDEFFAGPKERARRASLGRRRLGTARGEAEKAA